MQSRDQIEIDRVWRRQRLLVLERSPAAYHDIRTAIEEGREAHLVLNMIDVALDQRPTSATVLSAATQAFDAIRKFVTDVETRTVLELLGRVNSEAAPAVELKSLLLTLARKHHATTLLEGTYFDDVREFATDSTA